MLQLCSQGQPALRTALQLELHPWVTSAGPCSAVCRRGLDQPFLEVSCNFILSRTFLSGERARVQPWVSSRVAVQTSLCRGCAGRGVGHLSARRLSARASHPPAVGNVLLRPGGMSQRAHGALPAGHTLHPTLSPPPANGQPGPGGLPDETREVWTEQEPGSLPGSAWWHPAVPRAARHGQAVWLRTAALG